MTTNLCSRFPALSPFSVRRESFHDVLTVYIRLLLQTARLPEQNGEKKDEIPEGAFVIGNTLYKPAQNDDWW